MKRTRVDDLHKEWMKNPKYRREYEALEEEFSLTAALIEARSRTGLTQEQVATNEDNSGSCGAAGRWRQYAIHANLGKIREGNWKPFADQFRASSSTRRMI